jgi:hypothetical protein
MFAQGNFSAASGLESASRKTQGWGMLGFGGNLDSLTVPGVT